MCILMDPKLLISSLLQAQSHLVTFLMSWKAPDLYAASAWVRLSTPQLGMPYIISDVPKVLTCAAINVLYKSSATQVHVLFALCLTTFSALDNPSLLIDVLACVLLSLLQ
jgi:hypothetical protein